MKGEILLKALEIIEDVALSQIDFLEAVLASGYGAGMNKIDHEYKKRRRIYEDEKYRKQDLENRKRRLRVFISKMKHDGLIDESKKESNKFKISYKGKSKLKQLKSGLPGRHYETKEQYNPVIISFDIPERFRPKRDWLREVIRNLGFKMIHQSVWIGKIKIPKDMIMDMEDLKILEYVEIFEVGQTGTLKKLGK